MKQTVLSVVIVCALLLPSSVVRANEEISLSSLIELLIALEIISPEKADLARGFLGQETGRVITHDPTSALERHKRILPSLTACGNGNDYYDGGGGFDTLQMLGKRSEYYIVEYSDGSYLVKDLVQCREDTDTVINIEQFNFTDGVLVQEQLRPNFTK